MCRLFNELVYEMNRMSMTDVFVLAVFFVTVGMFCLRGSVLRPK